MTEPILTLEFALIQHDSVSHGGLACSGKAEAAASDCNSLRPHEAAGLTYSGRDLFFLRAKQDGVHALRSMHSTEIPAYWALCLDYHFY